MNLDYDSTKAGKKWVSCFDLLGFGNYVRENGVAEAFCRFRSCRDEQVFYGGLNSVAFVWFSDTFIFYSLDDSPDSFCAITTASHDFFDELLLAKVPLRGALAFGDFYADKTNGVFLGEALVDAYSYEEKFNWLGFVLHPSALSRMNEIGKPVSEAYETKWNAELRNQRTNRMEREDVIAYRIGSAGEWPLAGGNPYMRAVEEMAVSASSKHDRQKYANTVHFLKSLEGPSCRPEKD
jgi:hypothetical protein